MRNDVKWTHHVLGDECILLATSNEDALMPVGLNGYLAATLHATAAALLHTATAPAGSPPASTATTVTSPTSTSAAKPATYDSRDKNRTIMKCCGYAFA